MSEDNEDLQDIPTLTDVVRPGNPSLVFNLSPPPASEEDEALETEAIMDETADQSYADSETEIETQAEQEQTEVSEESVKTEPITVTSASGSYEIDLKELGLPDTFFEQRAESADSETEVKTAQGEEDFNPESLMMALEAPVSGILQKHMEMAREEILDLIREEVARQLRAHGVSRD